ncbi:MAG TPA: hypothetical protein VD862_00135 [Candidatus Paceibacterota bacterium]|nr:hypothetical protein [Candidatus Paceibacterota bacterium]
MKQKTLLAAAAGFLAVLFGAIPVRAWDVERKQGWNPKAGLDVLQPGYNLSGDAHKFHVTVAGAHVSFFRLGRFRLPSLGTDFQARFTETPSQGTSVSGHWLLTSGIKFLVEEDPINGESGLHAKGFYDTRSDPDPRVGRWGFVVGVYFGF